MNTEPVRKSRFPVTSAVWRCVARPLRPLWRRKLKISLWLTTLIVLGWQYENWQGRRAYQEQLALFRAEYGGLKWNDFAPPRIPDEENFFAAPVFETFVVKKSPGHDLPPSESDSRRDYRVKRNALLDSMPHSRLLDLKLPEFKTPGREVQAVKVAEGLETLDTSAWAKAEAAAGREQPPGVTSAQWLHSVMPPDDAVNGLMEAAARPAAAVLPHRADRQKLCDDLNDPYAYPLPAVSGLWQASKALGLRARAAARAGDSVSAERLTRALIHLISGYMADQSLVAVLVAFALEPAALDAVAEGLACRCWNDAQLSSLGKLLNRTDEEAGLFMAFYSEGFRLHVWPGDIQSWHRKQFNDTPFVMKNWSWRPREMYMTFCAKGPDGWIDANLGNNLRWWRMFMMPDAPGDDLMAFRDRLNANVPLVMKQTTGWGPEGTPSPRKVWAAITIPAVNRIADSALQYQTRRRQLLLAIAIERHLLAKGTLPQKAEDLVPGFLDAIPGDPWQPGTPLRWEAGGGGIRYRILSAGKDAVLGFPEQVH